MCGDKRHTRGVVQNKVISDWIVSNQSDYHVCLVSDPTHLFLDQSDDLERVCIRLMGQGGTQIQTRCGEEANVRGLSYRLGDTPDYSTGFWFMPFSPSTNMLVHKWYLSNV